MLQLVLVAAISIAFRRHIPVRLNVLLSSLFVTVPIWNYVPLADVGMVFLFDIAVPILLLREIYLGRFVVRLKPVAIVGLLVFLIPAVYAPIGYLFLPPSYIGYHTVIVGLMLYRSLLIFLAVLILARELLSVDHRAVAGLMAFQFLVLFGLGSLQYLAGIDFVIYERLKDVENVVDTMLSGDQKILFGFGFLGLFRGAVPQMAIVGVFWWLLASLPSYSRKHGSAALILMCVLAIVCVGGSLSRIGILAIGSILLYAVYINRPMRLWALLLLVAGLPLLLFGSYLDSIQVAGFDLIAGRFDIDQFTGEIGSGGTRIESAGRLAGVLQTSWLQWIVGLGGFNPITANEYFGVFGMHGDYLDVIARHGLFVGLLYIILVFVLFMRQLGGFFSDDPQQHEIPRAFGVLAIGIVILAITQGALTFSGSAGYLASAQSWMAIAFCIVVRQKIKREVN